MNLQIIRKALIFSLCISYLGTFAQDTKITTDRLLETTGGILKLFEKKPKETSVKSNLDSAENMVGKVSITNKTGRRISFSIKSSSNDNAFQKNIVLGIDDMDYINNLPIGSYSYTAKFEDGTIAKSGDLEIGKDVILVEKIIR